MKEFVSPAGYCYSLYLIAKRKKMLAFTWTMVSWTLFSRDLSYSSLSWSSPDSPISHWSPTALPYICAPQLKVWGKVNHLSLFLLQGCWIPILNEYFIYCLLASPDPFYPSLLCWKPASLDYSTVSLTIKKHSSCWMALSRVTYLTTFH